MNKNIFFLAVYFFVSLLSLSSTATLLDLDTFLNRPENESVLRLFKATEELHIGGTNTYGNRTTYKEGDASRLNELDPRILIINPDPHAHAKSDDVLGILGSAFDLRLIEKLIKICDYHSHNSREFILVMSE